MQVSIEKINDIDHKLTICVPQDQIASAYQSKMHEMAARTTLKGFRPGKVPMRMLEERYGNEIRKEALSAVIQNSLSLAIEQHQLNPINTPQIEPKAISNDQPFEFIASFEVLPDYSNIQCKLERIKKPVVAIQEEDIQNVIERLCKQHTKWHKIDREAKAHDRVVINYQGNLDDASDKQSMDHVPVELGSKTMLPGFEDQLIGVKTGEKREFTLSFPSDWHDKERAGKPVQFTVEVKEIYEADAPLLNQAFVKQLGIKSGELEDLKNEIKRSLEQECERLIQGKLKEQIFTQLLLQNTISVPTSLIQREAKRIHDERHSHHGKACAGEHPETETAAFHEAAEKRVALGLLIAAYAKEAKLVVDQTRFDKRLINIASSYEKPEEMIKWLLTQREYRSNIEAQVLEEMVLEQLMAGVPVEDDVLSYSELREKM
ncbi:MAG: trigger factor [Gammaproteobacteria bacterium RIFCSPHIGHO2_12_FULL_42_10]|nr:MAG: trigger factor [Gammaproteobacteria bacterium RIFCSPHIGHO2_12_FULL_42_10]